MKINDTQQKLLEAYLNQAQAVQAQVQNQQNLQQQPQPADKVDLSSRSRLMQQINKAMSVEQSDRAEMVDALKQQVQEGTYKVDTGRVANKMMTDLLKDLG